MISHSSVTEKIVFHLEGFLWYLNLAFDSRIFACFIDCVYIIPCAEVSICWMICIMLEALLISNALKMSCDCGFHSLKYPCLMVFQAKSSVKFAWGSTMNYLLLLDFSVLYLSICLKILHSQLFTPYSVITCFDISK